MRWAGRHGSGCRQEKDPQGEEGVSWGLRGLFISEKGEGGTVGSGGLVSHTMW